MVDNSLEVQRSSRLWSQDKDGRVGQFKTELL